MENFKIKKGYMFWWLYFVLAFGFLWVYSTESVWSILGLLSLMPLFICTINNALENLYE